MARVVMSDQVARRIVLMIALGVVWGIASDAMDLPWFVWLGGLVALDLALFRRRRPRPAKEPERVGPPPEWID